MPRKTKAEIEQIVRKFYKDLTENPFYLIDDPDQKPIQKTISEAEIQQAIDAFDANQEIQQKAANYIERRNKSARLVEELCEEYDIHPEIAFDRSVNPAMDFSGTEEAKKKNVEILRRLSKKENLKEFLQGQINLALNFDLNPIINTNPVDGVDLLNDPATNAAIQATYIAAADIVPMAERLGIQLTQAQKDLMSYNELMLGSCLPKIAVAQKALADDSTYCINPNIPFIKELLQVPSPYGTFDDNEAFDFIVTSYPETTNKTPFKDRFAMFNLHKIFEEQGIVKNPDYFEQLKDGKTTTFTLSNGKQRIGKFDGQQLLSWERSIQPSTLQPTDSYDKVLAEENKLFNIASDAQLSENASPEFQQVLTDLNALHDFYKKNNAPDTPSAYYRFSGVHEKLKSSISAFRKTLNFDTLNDPANQKRAELCDTLLQFSTAEYACRQAYVKNSPYNLFSKELTQLLADPKYDFNPANPVDSLRICSFMLFKQIDEDDNQIEKKDIQEQTNYLFTTDPQIGETAQQLEQKMKTDAYELLHSQNALQSAFNQNNYDLYQAAQTCSAVIYPKNGDASKARMLYVDKNGKPRISEPLDKMPILGDTLDELDRLKAEGDPKYKEIFKSYPDKMHVGINANAAEKEAAYENNRRRNEFAQAYWTKACERFFPDAANPELLISNSINYSAARQNFAFSSYGEYELSPEEQAMPGAVEAAKNYQAKAIEEALIQRQFESETIFDAQLHPDYYKTHDLAQERQKFIKAKAELSFGHGSDESSALYESHHYDTATIIEEHLKANNLSAKDVSFFDGKAAKIGVGSNAKPWDKVEGAASLLDNDKAIYVGNGETINKLRFENGELVSKDVSKDFMSPENVEKRHSTLENFEYLKNLIAETGTTRRDSAEFRAMLTTVNQAYELARKCDVNQQSTEAVIAAQKLETAKRKVADACDAYYVAKVDQSMNSRRGKRFTAAMIGRLITDPEVNDKAYDRHYLMRNAIATKMLKARYGEAPVDRAKLRRDADNLVDNPGFNAMTQDTGKLDKLFTTKTAKLETALTKHYAIAEAAALNEELKQSNRLI